MKSIERPVERNGLELILGKEAFLEGATRIPTNARVACRIARSPSSDRPSSARTAEGRARARTGAACPAASASATLGEACRLSARCGDAIAARPIDRHFHRALSGRFTAADIRGRVLEVRGADVLRRRFGRRWRSPARDVVDNRSGQPRRADHHRRPARPPKANRRCHLRLHHPQRQTLQLVDDIRGVIAEVHANAPYPRPACCSRTVPSVIRVDDEAGVDR